MILGIEMLFAIFNLVFLVVLIILAFVVFEVPKKERRLYKYFKKLMWENEQKELYGFLTSCELEKAHTHSEVTISKEGFDIYNSEEGIIAQAKFAAAIDFPPVKIPETDFDEIKFTVDGNNLTKISLTTSTGEIIEQDVCEQI